MLQYLLFTIIVGRFHTSCSFYSSRACRLVRYINQRMQWQQKQLWDPIFALIYFIIFLLWKIWHCAVDTVLWSISQKRKLLWLLLTEQLKNVFWKERGRERLIDRFSKVELDPRWKTGTCRRIALETPRRNILQINMVSF